MHLGYARGVNAPAPVKVAAVNDYELIVAGLARLLSHYSDRIEVCDRVILGEPLQGPVDVALYDTYGRLGVASTALRELASDDRIAHVAMFSLDLTARLIEDGREAGASGFISKALSGPEIAEAIQRVASGDEVIAASASPKPAMAQLDWPGKQDGLTERESQVVVLAAEGLSNREIAAALYLSVETVKGYMRQIFAKLGVRNRVQATNYVHRSGGFTRLESQPADEES